MKYVAYEHYKPSGIEWLPQVPFQWQVKGLRHVCRFAYGGALAAENREEGEVAVYGSNGQVGTHDTPNTLAPVIVVGRKGSFGKLNYSNERVFAIDTTYFIDKRYCPEDLDWLAYALQPLKLDEASKDSAVPGLAREDAYKHKLPVPSLDEQQAIARFLDAKTAQIDALVAQKRQLIDRLKEKRSALIARTVTRGLPPEAAKAAGLEPNPQMKDSGVEWLGEIPATWRLVPLGYLVRMRGGATPDKGKPEYWDGTIPWASPKDMKVARIFDVEDHISDEALHNSPLSLIPEAALLIVVRGMILAHSFPVALAMRELTINQDMKALVCCRGIRPNYLYWTLCGFATSLISLADESAHGTKKIETALLARFPIFVPGLSEQQAIADYLDRETTRLDALVTQIDEAASRLTEYRQSLITSAVTGKIDVREFRHARESGHPEEVAHVAA